jgi:hypothetical protein
MEGLLTTVPRALDSARRVPARLMRTGRRSLLLGTVLLVASTLTVLAAANTPPHITSLTASSSFIDEGQSITLNGTFTDPDATDLHTIFIYWGDGNPGQAEKIQLPAGQFAFQANHAYQDNLVTTLIKVGVGDRQRPPGTSDNTDGEGRDTGLLPIQVRNIAPTLAGVSASRSSTTFQPLTSVSIVVVGDIVDPGAADTEQVSALWGDAAPTSLPTPTPCTVTGRRFRCTHAYKLQPAARTYTINLSVRDDDGGQGSATTSVQIPALPSNSQTGTFDVSPKNARIAAGAPLTYEVSWTVPHDRVWRVLNTIDLRLRKGQDTALGIRWDEATNALCLIDDSDTCGPSGAVGAAQLLESPIATLNLGVSSVQGSGPTGRSVALKLALIFKPQAAAETYAVDLGATDDEGRHDDFKHAGTLGVER